MKTFTGSICIRQRVLASYRKPFFDDLASRCQGGCVVIAGQPDTNETLNVATELDLAQFIELRNTYRGSGTFERYFQPELEKELRNLNPSVFVSEANPRLVDMRKTLSAMRKRSIPCLGWGIGTTDFWNKPLKKLRQIFRKRFIQQFDGMICYSSIAAEQYASLGFPRSKLFPIYNAVLPRPTGTYVPRPSSNGRPARIITIGRLLESKGIDRLINAAAMTHANGESIELLIVGDGADRQRLEGVASSVSVPVRFAGHQTGENLAELAKNSDLFVLPGLGGLAIQEAMAFGLPVIVTEADGTEADLVRENGWICKKEDITDLARCIDKALSDRPDLERRGKESFRVVQEEINRELMADRFIDAVNCICQDYKATT